MPATNTYITIDDVENIKIKQMYNADPTYIQEFLDETCLWYEAYAQSLNVLIDDILYPVSQYCLDFLRAELSRRIGNAHIGGSENTSSQGDVYTIMYNMGRSELDRLYPRINGLAITQQPSRTSDTVVFGRVVRS